jgi:hypothetical protein
VQCQFPRELAQQPIDLLRYLRPKQPHEVWMLLAAATNVRLAAHFGFGAHPRELVLPDTLRAQSVIVRRLDRAARQLTTQGADRLRDQPENDIGVGPLSQVPPQQLHLLEAPGVLTRHRERQRAHLLLRFERLTLVHRASAFEYERPHLPHRPARRLREPEFGIIRTHDRCQHRRHAPAERARNQRVRHSRQTVEPTRQSARLLGPTRRALAPLERIRLDRREPEGMVSTASLEPVQPSTHLEAQSPSFACPTRELRVERFQSLD